MTMPIPEGYSLRDGDTILVRATVRFSVDKEEQNVYVRTASYRDFGVKLDEIAGIESFRFAVGDKAESVGCYLGTIIAIHEESAWLKPLPESSIQAFRTIRLADLRPPKSSVFNLGDAPRGELFEPVPPVDEILGRFYPNGMPKFAPDGTLLDEKGNRSIFDDVDK